MASDSMRDQRVSLVRCPSYEEDEVDRAVGRAFSLLGGLDRFIRPSDSVFLKINGLSASPPERGVTTDPRIVRSVARQVREVTDRVVIGDSPGGPYNPTYLKRLYRKTGMEEVASVTGASLNYDTGTVNLPCPGGYQVKSVELCRPLVEADKVINLPKLKTHMLVNLTCAVKNMFGSVPGLMKPAYHGRFRSATEFSHLLLDVYLTSKPHLTLVDGVRGMDGNGPSSGRIRDLGYLVAGQDGLAVDTAVTHLLGMDLSQNPVLESALSRGLCETNAENIEFLGEEPSSLRITDFELPNKVDISERVPAFLMKWFGKRMSPLPTPSPTDCTACGHCEEVCPVGAISVTGGSARIDRSRCIICYCCYEVCEFEAIDLDRAWLGRMIDALTRKRRPETAG